LEECTFPPAQISRPGTPLSAIPGEAHRRGAVSAVSFPARYSFALFASLAGIYLLLAAVQFTLHPAGNEGGFHFILLANGWFHGHLYVEGTPPALGDFTEYKGHWYVAFPPLPAILLLPLVAIFHLSHQALISLCFAVAAGILNIWLWIQVLTRFVRNYLIGGTFSTVSWLAALFALGSEVLYATMQGSVWFVAHVVATTFLLLYIDEVLGKGRSWLAAFFLGLAALSRSTTLFTFPFFLIWICVVERKQPLVIVKKWAVFGVVLAAFVAGMLLYNYARFGSLFDFGYSTMNINRLVSRGLHTYGQFSSHFLSINLHYMLVQPPILLRMFPYVTFNPFGTGLFWTMPALLFMLLAFRRRRQFWLATALFAACVVPIIWVLMYFNTGWYQFGYRFVLDFLPFLFLLALLGMSSTPTWREKVLITLCVLINVWGYIVFAYFPPRTF